MQFFILNVAYLDNKPYICSIKRRCLTSIKGNEEIISTLKNRRFYYDD